MKRILIAVMFLGACGSEPVSVLDVTTTPAAACVPGVHLTAPVELDRTPMPPGVSVTVTFTVQTAGDCDTYGNGTYTIQNATPGEKARFRAGLGAGMEAGHFLQASLWIDRPAYNVDAVEALGPYGASDYVHPTTASALDVTVSIQNGDVFRVRYWTDQATAITLSTDPAVSFLSVDRGL